MSSIKECLNVSKKAYCEISNVCILITAESYFACDPHDRYFAALFSFF